MAQINIEDPSFTTERNRLNSLIAISSYLNKIESAVNNMKSYWHDSKSDSFVSEASSEIAKLKTNYSELHDYATKVYQALEKNFNQFYS